MGKREILQGVGDFNKENWDGFFAGQGLDNPFECHAEWTELRDLILSHLSVSPSSQILVPGCGVSRLSEHLYDAGFRCITNIDFAKVAISHMSQRNMLQRACMRWCVMDLTPMQFMDESFDAVLDKGGLDALMVVENGAKLGNQYLSEVKRVTRAGGKFICFTFAESHVLDLLLPQFRFGWKTSIVEVPQDSSAKLSYPSLMVVAAKADDSSALHPLFSSLPISSFHYNTTQASELYEGLEKENRIREDYSKGNDISYSLEDLQLEAKGDLKKLHEGRRIKLNLGGNGASKFRYGAVLVDAKEQFGPFMQKFGAFIVSKNRSHEWTFSSEEGQWMIVESSKAARLVMVLLDKSHTDVSMDTIQKDLTPLMKQLAPAEDDKGTQISFMMATDGIRQRSIINQVTSTITGQVKVEDVIYEKIRGDASGFLPTRVPMFRRLIFQRAEGLVQSEALLTKEASEKPGDVCEQLKVDHGYLASFYHMGILSGFTLISEHLETVASAGNTVNTVVIGLGAGLLPMFLHASMPFLDIKVVELDPIVLGLAREYFTFAEEKHLKVHIADGIQFLKEVESSSTAASAINGFGTKKIDILIIDVDSLDSSSGMICPAADFLEESFLQTAKDTLSEQGLFVVNLVTQSPAINDTIISRMKGIFGQLFALQLEEDGNEVLFALPSKAPVKEDCLSQAAAEKLLQLKYPEIGQIIMDTVMNIRPLK